MMNFRTIQPYCVKNDLFTGGSNKQYSQMFQYADEHPTNYHDVALMIWICSYTNKTIEIIENDLRNL